MLKALLCGAFNIIIIKQCGKRDKTYVYQQSNLQIFLSSEQCPLLRKLSPRLKHALL
jgi:hypothetical protein